VYNLENLTLNNSTLPVVGPVIITLAKSLVAKSIGSSARPDWLVLRIGRANLEQQRDLQPFNGKVIEPHGTATING